MERRDQLHRGGLPALNLRGLLGLFMQHQRSLLSLLSCGLKCTNALRLLVELMMPAIITNPSVGSRGGLEKSRIVHPASQEIRISGA